MSIPAAFSFREIFRGNRRDFSDLDDMGDRGTGPSFAESQCAGDSSTLLIDPSGRDFRGSSLMASTYEEILVTRAAKRLRIGGRQAQIKATVGSVVLQVINLRASPLPE